MATKKHNITLKNVAEAANCSIAAVSTVLNHAKGNSLVGEELRTRITETAIRLGYQANFASQVLKSRRSHTIGIYVQPKRWNNISNLYEMCFLPGIERAARELGYELLLLNMSTDLLPEVCLKRMREGRIDGVLLLHADRDGDWLHHLLAASNNVVALDCAQENTEVSHVLFDEQAALELGLNYLLEHGHRKIGFIAECCNPHTLRERNFRLGAKKLHIPLSKTSIFNAEKCVEPIDYESEYCQQEGRQGIRYFAALPPSERPDAILCYNYLVGIFAQKEAALLNWNVPEELSILAIDNYDFLDFLSPRLTVIDHHMNQIGYQGVQLLIDQIEGVKNPPQNLLVAPAIVPGATVKHRLQ